MSGQLSTWEVFFREGVQKIFAPGARVLDIGGGLRVDKERGNVVDPSRFWIKPLLEKVTYQVMDPVETYHPDIIGDIMQMPSHDASYEAIICLAVLEHVPRPWDAVKEMFRVLKPGGHLLLYVPFLYPYHSMPGYYGDYFRFTEEAVRSLLEPFNQVNICPVRGPAETIANLLPGRLRKWLSPLGRWVDIHRKGSGKRVSGFYVIGTKPF
jgi:ubiquinone/menaquinone biosynthesis C-methylase UbiE